MAVHYAIGSIEEAAAYLAHPILETRLLEITEAMNAAVESDPVAILGAVDAAKFRSCMTLFSSISSDQTCFRVAIDKFFEGRIDLATAGRVGAWQRMVASGKR